MSEEKKKVIQILRSLIISSPQNGKSLRELIRDYHECEGSKIPIFGFESVEAFLRGSGEIIIENFRGELIIYQNPNAKSSHIAKLVAEQNKPKKTAIASRFRQPVRPTNLPPQRCYPVSSSFRSPTKVITPARYNDVSNSPRSTPVHARSQAATMEFSFEKLNSQQAENNFGQNRLVNEVLNRVNEVSSRINDVSNRMSSNQFVNQQQYQSADLRNRINEIRGKQSPVIVDLTLDSSDDSKNTRPTAYPQNNQFAKNSTPITPKKLESFVPSQHRKDAQPLSAPASANVPYQHPNNAQPTSAPATSYVEPQIMPNNPFFDASLPPPTIRRMQERIKTQPVYDSHSIVNKNIGNSAERKSVNTRLENARRSLPVIDATKPTINVRTTPQQSSITQLSPLLQSDEKKLDDFCRASGKSVPKFKIFKCNNRFQCHITIDEIRYSKYPTDYGSQNEAQLETAKYALEKLESNQNQQKYEVCLDNENDLAIKIYDCIKDCPTGIFLKKIPDKFVSFYAQTLPPNWMNSLFKYPKCFTIVECIDDHIVYVVEAAELDQKMDKLQLPWHDEYWCLVITCTVSTAEVWGRLIGTDHSNALDLLVTDIELELMKNKEVCKTLNVGQICLVLMNECAYRVRVEKVDDSNEKCLCFFVDEGDVRSFNMTELYVCQNKFTKLAPQAIRFALHGLEEFDENDFAKKHLEDTLLCRPPLIGQVFTKKEDFISQEESNDLVAVIQVVLYDTSTEDDVNLHPIIVEKIITDIPPPELIPVKLTPVIVSHIADNGDIFCQLKENGLHYVNKLIHKLTQPDLSNRHQTVSVTNSSNNKLFLVFDDEMNKWCRGELIRNEKHGNTMFLVDYGKTKIVPLSKIFPLESLSQALLTFPPQAMQVKLSGFNEFPEHLVSTLRGYFSDTNAYATKSNVRSIIPEVSLYFVKDKNIECVNECINLLERPQTIDTQFSRQSSTTSNTSRDSRTQEELLNFDNLTISKLPKFKPPEVGNHFDIEVVMTATPSNFQIRPIRLMPQWVQQMRSLQEYCNKCRDTMELNMIREGEAYACLRSDGSWWRAIVECHRDSKVFVSFCDTGDIESIDDVKKLKALPEEYRALPKLAITAELFGIRPNSRDWEMDDIIEFNRLVSRKKFQAIVGKITEKPNPDENAVLEIRLIDVSKEDDECINDKFVESGRAIACFAH